MNSKKQTIIGILHTLFQKQGPVTIKELAQELETSFTTAKKSIDHLQEIGLLMEVGNRDTESGRKPSLYDFNDSSHYWVGLDLEIPELQIALYSMSNHLVNHSKAVLNINKIVKPEDLSKMILDNLKSFLDSEDVEYPSILGCGIGTAGTVYSDTFHCFSRPIPGETFSLRREVEDLLNVPTVMGNDIDMELISELDRRGFLETDDKIAVCFSARRSNFEKKHIRIGGSIFGNGKLLRGDQGTTGEFGHSPAPIEVDSSLSPQPHCGNPDCLETYVNDRFDPTNTNKTPDEVRRVLEKKIRSLLFSFNPALLLLDLTALPDISDPVLDHTKEFVQELNKPYKDKIPIVSSLKDTTLACSRGAVIQSQKNMLQNPERYKILSN